MRMSRDDDIEFVRKGWILRWMEEKSMVDMID